MEFKVGDIVISTIYVGEFDVKNKIGVIKAIDTSRGSLIGTPYATYGIEFFEFISGHSGTWLFTGKQGHCWNFRLGSFKHINKLKLKKLLET